MIIHPSWYRKGSEERSGRVFPQPASTLHPQRGSPLRQPVCRQAGGSGRSDPSFQGRAGGIKDISLIKTMLVEKTSPSLNSYGVRIALTRLRAFRYHQSGPGKSRLTREGNVAQWQSGRFISARSQVRTLSLPHQTRRPIGRLDSRAVSSVVRALASHARGPRFDPSTAHQGPGVVGADEGIWPARATRAFGSLTEVPLECGCAEVAERQTRYVQGVVPLWVCGFKSHLRHQRARSGEIVSVRALVAQLDRAQPCGG